MEDIHGNTWNDFVKKYEIVIYTQGWMMKINHIDIDEKSTFFYDIDRKEMLRYIPKDVHKILDIGCGEGNFSYLCKQIFNAEVWGIELKNNDAEKAVHKIDKVLIGDIESNNLEIPDSYFDCIVFNDVLEHLQYPWLVLLKVKKYLKSGGYIVASIPNVRYYSNLKNLLFNKSWEYVDWGGVMDKTHLRFFSVSSIDNMFTECGYNVLKLEGINGIKFSWKLKLLNKILKNHLDDIKYLQFACVAKYEKI
jgi:2-polyprenyl-3-methyl-5-hydroxy-6-metoxy-1,4-benzoquinol methylase